MINIKNLNQLVETLTTQTHRPTSLAILAAELNSLIDTFNIAEKYIDKDLSTELKALYATGNWQFDGKSLKGVRARINLLNLKEVLTELETIKQDNSQLIVETTHFVKLNKGA